MNEQTGSRNVDDLKGTPSVFMSSCMSDDRSTSKWQFETSFPGTKWRVP